MTTRIIHYFSFTLAIFAFALHAQEHPLSSPGPITNVVRTPIHMKGLYQNKNKTVQPPNTTDDAVAKSLHFFKEKQNSDGSWGNPDQQSLATSLILLSFLGRGETAVSCEFGTTVLRARDWLLKAHAPETASRIVMAISLLAYCDLSYVSAHLEQKTSEVAKIHTLLADKPNAKDEVWLDFAAFHSMLTDYPKPSWMHSTKKIHDKYLVIKASNSPLTVDEYLRVYLVGFAHFHRGGKPWKDLNYTATSELMKRQQADGGYPVAEGQDRFAATALATLRLEIYCEYEP